MPADVRGKDQRPRRVLQQVFAGTTDVVKQRIVATHKQEQRVPDPFAKRVVDELQHVRLAFRDQPAWAEAQHQQQDHTHHQKAHVGDGLKQMRL